MPKPKNELPSFHAHNRQEWRAWLTEHHASAPGVWLIYYKKASGKPAISYDEIVEEALCFGWVDSRPNALDDERAMFLVSPRNPQSPWSRLNKQRVERLIEQGLMTGAGLVKIEAARQNGAWNQYDDIEDLIIPDDLQTALDANPAAQTNFAVFPPSSKKTILWWIASAKRPQTRAKRIEETVTLAAKNIKANHYRQ
ncbi:MAG: YdeI/OmpD-associated family protein [Chloroflexota bacterium]